MNKYFFIFIVGNTVDEREYYFKYFMQKFEKYISKKYKNKIILKNGVEIKKFINPKQLIGLKNYKLIYAENFNIEILDYLEKV